MNRARAAMNRLCVLGQGGRLGTEVLRLASEAGLARVDAESDAEVLVLCLPSEVVARRLEQGGWPGRSVIDLSTAAKVRGARYGLMNPDGSGRLFSGDHPQPGELHGNPGCIASGVLVGLERAGLRAHLRGPIHVTAIGSRSYAHPSSQGELRLARRLRSHPHVSEIERAWPGLSLGHFAPVTSYGTPRGLMVVVSGALEAASGLAECSPAEPLDVCDVVGTARLECRLEHDSEAFTVVVVLDNLTFVAANAVALAQALMR